MKLSVLICSYAESIYLAETIRTLLATIAGVDIELLVDVEQHPTGLVNTPDRYQRLFQQATGDIIVKSDDDCEYLHGWWGACLSALRENKDIACICPAMPDSMQEQPGPIVAGHVMGLCWVFRPDLWNAVPYTKFKPNCLDSLYAERVFRQLGKRPAYLGVRYCRHRGHNRRDRKSR